MPSAKKSRTRPTVGTRDVVIPADRVPAVREADKATWDALPDTDIDTADIPELTDADFAAMDAAAKGPGQRPNKQMISLRLDAQVISFFKAMGPGYQRRMHAVLRSYAERAGNRTKR